ncbi:protein sidekick isoform X5 [Sitodiplosis mosellana]|uniref:protein sidekick isoform X5 n=1 Tax=Sitodiplosis mosellana TaxID=263140 RepID=UPI002445351C|nr:protein sidekick isoform X5 [Sitodiplosis mosellana]
MDSNVSVDDTAYLTHSRLIKIDNMEHILNMNKRMKVRRKSRRLPSSSTSSSLNWFVTRTRITSSAATATKTMFISLLTLCHLLGFTLCIDSSQQLQPPRFTTQPSSSGSIVSEGRTKILQCHALGYPQPMYRWLKDGIPVTDFSTGQYYRIPNTRRDDAGSYQCMARNDAGTIFSEKIDVVVAYMGNFEDITERRVSVESGHPAILDLPPIESIPPPSVTWQDEEHQLKFDIKYAETLKNQLIILSVDESDAKSYRARAINTQLGKEENSAFIHLNVSGSDSYDGEIAPEIIVHPSNLRLVRGEEVSQLQCIANARPLHELETLWLKDGILIENTGIAHTLDDPWNRTLALLTANLTHTGQYTCQVRLRSGGFPTVTSTATVTVQEPPTFFSPLRTETLGEYGSTLVIPCDVIGEPTPHVTWFRNADALDMTSERYIVQEDNSLVIKKLSMDDSAMFQCLASNDAGEKSSYTWLRVKNKGAFVDNNASINELSTNHLTVDSNGIIRNRKKRFAQPRIIRVRASSSATASKSSLSSISYDSATLSGTGHEVTTKNRKLKGFRFDSTTLPGSSTPIMEQSPKNITILDGKDATIVCRAVGAPQPNVTWTYNDTTPVELTGRVQVLENGDLLISNVRESDAGWYNCIRSNEAGSVTGQAYLGVMVRTQIVQPPADTRVLLGLTATLQCRVSSDPSVPFNIDWYRDGQPAPIMNSQRVGVQADGTLEIQAVRASDVGVYSCMVTSPGGNETRSARLSVIELPFPPTNVKAIRYDTQTYRSINVSWTAGFDGNSPILKFIIQRREVPELEFIGPIPDPLLNWITELSNVSSNQRWILLRNLKAASVYQFRVSAVNSVGEGPPSEPSNVIRLPQEAPSGPPVGFVGSARSSSEIITQWQPPLEEHRNGQILGYIIRYRLYGYNDSPWTIQNITNEAQRNYLIQELITWKDYIVQIAAFNNMGVGVFTDGAKIKTKEGIPEAPPTNVRVKPLNSTAIKVWWTPPNPQQINGINQGYKLQAWLYNIADGEEMESEAKMITVPPSLIDPLAEQSTIMSGLEKYTEYNITVLCFTDPGDGVRSESVYVKTKEDVPGEVASLQFDEVSDRAVKVLWSPPKAANGILTGYQVKYHVKDDPSTMKMVNLTAKETSLKVTKLVATTRYLFEVNAVTKVGAGAPKTATMQSGVEPVLPSPPTQLALSNIEAFSVVLQFTPSFDGNSSITKWTVEAQTARNLTWFTIYEISDPDASTLTVTGLMPFTSYRLRLIATNVVGPSEPSEPTKDFQTIQARPMHPPLNVTVRAMSATELRVRWIPLQQSEWFGNPRGYNITYRNVENGSASSVLSALIEDHTANSHVLDNLEEYAVYEVIMNACNDVGNSKDSPPALERTRESVPSVGPINVEANTTSSTTIVVRWGEVQKEHRNGQIEGYKVFYGAASRGPVLHKTIANNNTYTTTLTELKKFVAYHIQVLAYTRLGDGTLSTPPVRAQTFEDTPGAPSNVSFPDVSLTTARIIWDVPEEPNGEILAYRVTYSINGSTNLNYSREFPPHERTFRATNLHSERYYIFSVTAQTRLGWGKTCSVLVYTTNNRERPQAPSSPQISRSQVQAHQITFSWTPGRDGFAPLRYYTVQLRENEGPWISLSERVDPAITSFTATGLKPHTTYQFRIQATNDLGPSAFSRESIEVRTLPAAPSQGVHGLKVVPITTTSVRVQWNSLEHSYWNGDATTGGYRILFQPISDFPTALQATPKQEVMGIASNSMVLSDLTQDRNYEIIVMPFNSQGEGPPSPPVAVYVGEAVPLGEPRSVEGAAVSATEVRLRWKPPTEQKQNGDLLGYKIFYLVTDSPQELEEGRKYEEEIEVVPASSNAHSLVFLDKYTEYRVQLLAFNAAGDGPRSIPITVKTLQGLPGPPSTLNFTDITMHSLRVSWNAPKRKNGEILGYIVTYETTEENDKFSKQVKQKVSGTSLLVQNLEEEVTYTFTVRAQTIDYGPPIVGNVTTGPQEGSPAALRDLLLTKTVSSVELHWKNGPSGKGPILGYYIETKKRDDTRWETVSRTTGGSMQEFTVSYQTLLPSTVYSFRVISYNMYGISYPVYSKDPILTPSKLYLEYGYLQHKPFYRQQWFMVSLAATSIIIIIMIVAVLCVKSKSYKYKQEAQKTLEESMAMSIDDRQELALELYRSRHGMGNGTLSVNGGTIRRTMGRKPTTQPAAAAALGKSPPRPSPASVAYHSDEESLKCYDENPDDSSVTEKPSEVSSSDSQNSESENESVRSDPHSFVNHYANVNDTLRQSWKRQKPVRNYSSYTDSEPEGSGVMSLNGGQIIVNNMARSRAPLPGFSSFV